MKRGTCVINTRAESSSTATPLCALLSPVTSLATPATSGFPSRCRAGASLSAHARYATGMLEILQSFFRRPSIREKYLTVDAGVAC
jgi:hypothetical protein